MSAIRSRRAGRATQRNGKTPKTLQTEHGPVQINTPRDRDGSFEPQLVRKRQRRFEGFDEKILALYSRGMSTRDIEAYLRELYGVSVGRDLISRVTDAVMDDVRAWQARPLEDVYPVVFLDALVLKIRDGGSVVRKACYLALGVGMDGSREVLGLWFQESEGAKFWMQVLAELRHRGVSDILICCVDGLTGFPEAIEAVFPETVVQTCIVHLIRASLKYVPRRQYDQVTKDLRPIYTAIDADHALHALEAFEQKWGAQLPPVVKAWRDSWEHVIPFLAFPPEVRRVIYTTNAIEALNRQLRKAIKTKGSFPTEDAARKLDLPRHPQRRAAMDPNPGVDQSAAGVQNPLRRPTARLTPTQLLGRPPGLGRTAALGLLVKLWCCRRMSGERLFGLAR